MCGEAFEKHGSDQAQTFLVPLRLWNSPQESKDYWARAQLVYFGLLRIGVVHDEFQPSNGKAEVKVFFGSAVCIGHPHALGKWLDFIVTSAEPLSKCCMGFGTRYYWTQKRRHSTESGSSLVAQFDLNRTACGENSHMMRVDSCESPKVVCCVDFSVEYELDDCDRWYVLTISFSCDTKSEGLEGLKLPILTLAGEVREKEIRL